MKKSTILVTGGSGFIGSEVVYQLISKGHRVINLDIKRPSYKKVGVQYIQGDLRKKVSSNKLPPSIDYCIHLAAHIGNAKYSKTHAISMLEDNVLIDFNTTRLAKRLKVKRFVYVSSSLVYEQSRKFPCLEEDSNKIPPPKLAYSFEKVLGEQICRNYLDQYGMNYTICRLFNAYGINSFGMGDINSHVIADLLNKMLSGQYPLEIYGNGKQKRSFTHVSDLAFGIIKALESKKGKNEIFNIGNSKEYTIIEVAKTLWETLKKRKPLKVKNLPALTEDLPRNCANNSKAKKILGWKPLVTLDKGIKMMVENKQKL